MTQSLVGNESFCEQKVTSPLLEKKLVGSFRTTIWHHNTFIFKFFFIVGGLYATLALLSKIVFTNAVSTNHLIMPYLQLDADVSIAAAKAFGFHVVTLLIFVLVLFTDFYLLITSIHPIVRFSRFEY
jgi:hypothetical protein